MVFKFVAVLALVAAVKAGIISGPVGYSNSQAGSVEYTAEPAAYNGYSAPNGHGQQIYQVAPAAVIKSQPVYAKNVDEYDPHPQYKFGYDVQDYTSGDSKSQVESRDGDVVKGEYSLIDADGYKRTVQYTSDPEHGFNAVVHREPIGVKTAPVAYSAAPAVKTSYSAYAAPSAYSTASGAKSPYATPVVAYDH